MVGGCGGGCCDGGWMWRGMIVHMVVADVHLVVVVACGSGSCM